MVCFFFFKKFQKKENSVSEWVEGRIKLPYICGPENEKKSASVSKQIRQFSVRVPY